LIKIHSHNLAQCHSINNWQLKKKLATSHCVEMIATQHHINTSSAIQTRQAQCGQCGAERDVHKNKPYCTILDNISLNSPDTIDSMAYGSRRKRRMNNECCRPRCLTLSALLGRHNLRTYVASQRRWTSEAGAISFYNTDMVRVASRNRRLAH